MNQLIIRREKEQDYRIVEEITREAFWNLHVPGCDEHYLVHILRDSSDFIPELALVAEQDAQVVGSIYFSKSYIMDEQGKRHETITFGPVSVLPEFHHQGIGTALIEYAKELAAKLGYDAILIYGYPDYYKRFGFLNAKEFGISNPEGKYPLAHMVLELYEGALKGISGKAYESESFHIDMKMAEEYDTMFEPKVKMEMPSQEIFREIANTYL